MTITRIERVFSDMHVHMSDGTTVVCRNANNGLWESQGAITPPGPTPGPEYPDYVGITAEMINAAVAAAGGSTAAMMITAEQIAQGFNDAIANTYPDILTNKARAACLIGECAQESDWFKTAEEYNHDPRYAPYWGRGWIQLTWRDNYAAFGQWAVSFGLTSDPNYFVNNPDVVKEPKWAPYTAIFYFSKKFSGRTLWEWCDTESSPWYAISRAINYGDPTASYIGPSYALRGRVIDAVLAVTPDPTGGSGDTAPTRAVAWVMDHLMAFDYSQALGRLDPEATGYTDCSALWCYAYDKFGVKIGTWTGDQQNHGWEVKATTGAYPFDESGLVPGDLIFFAWSGYNTSTFDHVEGYIGNGECVGHGGPGRGPFVKNINSQIGAPVKYRVRRYA